MEPLRLAAAARHANTSIQQILNLIEHGVLPAVWTRNGWVMDADDLEVATRVDAARGATRRS